VAEGALDQIGNMLTRLKELATQASSANAGSNLDKLDAEAQKIIDEIDRIATSTKYAGSALIDGTFGVGGTADAALLANGLSGFSGLTADETYTITTAANVDNFDITVEDSAGNSQALVDLAAPVAGATKGIYFSAFGVTLTVNSELGADMDGDIAADATGSSTFQIGAENQADNRIEISLGNARRTELGTVSGAAAIDDIDLIGDARAALTIVDNAISDVAKLRGDIGAAQNRLAYTASNLAVTIENVQAAESVIRDVDMAAEMTTFTKNQILLQAGTAMLAQANMAPMQLLALFG
jgi:flagellin